MEQYGTMYEEQAAEKKGSVITGFIGALIGALLGAAVWAAVAIFAEIITALIALLIGFLAGKGYDLLKGRQGVAKVVCVIIAIIIGVVVGTGATYAWWIHEDYTTQIAELSELQRRFVMTESEYFMEYLIDSEFIAEVVKELAIGLLFAVLGCFSLLRDMARKPEAASAPVAADLSAAQVPAAAAAEPTAADADQQDDSASL